ncbi:hypothetical protein MNBD_GAMMA04-243 [hydrothermal vent metagenome]|uniref:DUF4174 domain-containing protein n=1 Tax=hydrothermal vent metagenome TaxID=652676 RepID=A0A3B0W4L9_9ZZZZ
MTTTASKPPFARWKKGLIYFVVLSVSAVLIWTQLPQSPYPTDLNRIGAGKPAVVLIYDVNTSGGMTVMKLLNPLRDEYGDQVEFLVASMGLPDGRNFAKHYGVSSGAVVFLLDDATHSSTVRAPENIEHLRQPLEKTLSKN